MNIAKNYNYQSKFLFAAWEQIGSPQLRSVCECAVGPFSLLPPFKDVSTKSIYIEPSAKMANQARINYPWAEIHQVAIAESFGKANLRNVGGSSYIKGIAWAPIFTDNPERARKAGKQRVNTVPFTAIDDGQIDILNLDCEGSEWFVLKNMISRPILIQIEHRIENPFAKEIDEWFKSNNYYELSRWQHGAVNIIYHQNI
jgi:hypothetical protein